MSDLQVNSPLVDNQLGIGGKGKVYFDNDSPRRRDRGHGNSAWNVHGEGGRQVSSACPRS